MYNPLARVRCSARFVPNPRRMCISYSSRLQRAARQLRLHRLILLAFEVPFYGVGTGLSGSWHTQSVLNPCPVVLGWPQGFPWLGNDMERKKQKLNSYNLGNTDP